MPTRAQRAPQPSVPGFQLSLHIRHPSLDPLKISETLWLEAVDSVAAGAPREDGRPAAVHRETYWAAEIPWQTGASDFTAGNPAGGNPATLRAIAAVREANPGVMSSVDVALSVTCFRFLAPHREFFLQMRADGATARLLVTLLPGELKGFTLVPDLSRLLAELGIAVEFEFLSQ